MKKTLFLLLLISNFAIGQTNPTAFKKIKVTENVVSTTAPFVAVEETDGVVNKINKSDLIEVIEYASAVNLPVTGVTGKIYVTLDNNRLYRWTGTIYQELTTDISGKENIANKQNSLAADGSNTKYPTVTAVNIGLALKANDTDVVKLTGNQSITGTKTFTASTAIANIFSINNSTAQGIYSLNNSTGLGIFSNNISTGIGISASNTSSGTGIYSVNTSTGNSIVSNMTGTGFNYVGQNNGVNTYTVDKLGTVTGASYIKSAATATNILLAGGTDITQASLPVSTATQTALNLKANLASPTFSGVPLAPTATAGTNTTQIATTAFVLANAGVGSLEFNATDLTVWNNGKGNIANNTSFGEQALRTNTSGDQNTAIGRTSLFANNIGGGNTSVGFTSMQSNTSGNNNTAIGLSSISSNISGSNNVANGLNSGRFIADGVTVNSITDNSVFIGSFTKPLANNQINQIVIGHDAIGAGSNTATLGNTSITNTILRGAVTTNGSFINSTAPATNALLANGTTLAVAPLTGGTGYIQNQNASAQSANMWISGIGTFAKANIGTTNSIVNFMVEDTGNTYATHISGNNLSNGVAIGTMVGNTPSIQGFTKTFSATSNISMQAAGGNLLIGTDSDNGSKLQVDGVATFSSSVTASLFKPTVYTVSTLPTPPSTGTGTYATVSDALAPSYMVTVVGGGAVVTPVFYNGTNWVAH